MKNPTNKQRFEVYKREGFACALCDSTRQLEVHHIIKRSLGGENNRGNLICLCAVCHGILHDQFFGLDIEGFPTKEETELGVIEYISDWYAENEGIAWHPKAD